MSTASKKVLFDSHMRKCILPLGFAGTHMLATFIHFPSRGVSSIQHNDKMFRMNATGWHPQLIWIGCHCLQLKLKEVFHFVMLLSNSLVKQVLASPRRREATYIEHTAGLQTVIYCSPCVAWTQVSAFLFQSLLGVEPAAWQWPWPDPRAFHWVLHHQIRHCRRQCRVSLSSCCPKRGVKQLKQKRKGSLRPNGKKNSIAKITRTLPCRNATSHKIERDHLFATQSKK